MRVLQLANSSYFGRPTDTLSIASAVNNVGMEVLFDLWETGSLLAAPDTADIDTQLAEYNDLAVETAQNLYAISQEEGVSDAECEDAYAIGLLSWVGEVIRTCGTQELKKHLQEKGAVTAAAYVCCLSGMPSRVSQIMEHLVNAEGCGGSAEQRAEEIGRVKYNRVEAF